MRILTFVFLMMVSPLFAKEKVGSIFYQKGEVSINNKISKKGLSLFNLDKIKTHHNAIVIIKLHFGATIKLNANSELIIDQTADRLQPILNKGSSFLRIFKDKLKNKKFNLKVQNVAMGVRGTEFFVDVENKKDNIWMCVNEGVVEVILDNEKKGTLVRKGMGVKISHNKSVTPPKFLPWTKKLNWNQDPEKGLLKNSMDIKKAYYDPLELDYD